MNECENCKATIKAALEKKYKARDEMGDADAEILRALMPLPNYDAQHERLCNCDERGIERTKDEKAGVEVEYSQSDYVVLCPICGGVIDKFTLEYRGL